MTYSNWVVTGGGWYDKVANKLFGANLNIGEIHAPMYTKDGWKFGSYIGPGTSIYDNVRSGKAPISDVDTAAQAHDIRYSSARNPEDVRKADLKLIQKLDDIQKNKSDSLFNIYMGKLPIKAKMALEDLNLLDKGSFSSKTGIADDKERQVLGDKLKELEVKGYGKKGCNKWINHVKAYQRQHNCSYKQAMTRARDSYKK